MSIKRRNDMTHRSRNTLTAIIAGGLLVLSAVSGTAFAHDNGGRGGIGPDPRQHGSVRPSHVAKSSHAILPWQKVHDPKLDDCANAPAAGSSATPVATGTAPTGPAAEEDRKQGVTLRSCSLIELKAVADAKIASLIASLQNLNGRVATITFLTAPDKASLDSEIASAIAELQALKVKVDAETTVAGVQADRKTLTGESTYVRAIGFQIRILAGLEKVTADDVKLDARVVTLTAAIAAAPSGIDTAAAQKYLDDMKANIASAKALTAALPARLLALTPADLKAGKTRAALGGIVSDFMKAMVDNIKARGDARMVQWILNGKPGFQGHHDHDKSPVRSLSPAPTATPV
jgi:hypothetical protein